MAYSQLYRKLALDNVPVFVLSTDPIFQAGWCKPKSIWNKIYSTLESPATENCKTMPVKLVFYFLQQLPEIADLLS